LGPPLSLYVLGEASLEVEELAFVPHGSLVSAEPDPTEITALTRMLAGSGIDCGVGGAVAGIYACVRARSIRRIRCIRCHAIFPRRINVLRGVG
jgi:hypothetical protein